MNREFLYQVELRLSILLFVAGIILSALALAAELLGLDITPGFGMIQMFQLLVGVTALTLAGYMQVHCRRRVNVPRSLQADIGIRLGATGLVLAYVCGLADLIGIGTHVNPAFDRPHVGPLQLGGLIIGVLTITVGLALYHTSRGSRQSSSLESLLPNGNG
jgi:hypothetical protein